MVVLTIHVKQYNNVLFKEAHWKSSQLFTGDFAPFFLMLMCEFTLEVPALFFLTDSIFPDASQMNIYSSVVHPTFLLVLLQTFLPFPFS